ncbi:MAG: cbb3-type cytochrome oxidase assembly protein CcoS [Campylobacterota bacterium]|nr:cbb3-type cytochrome oxidase assembly protein CcoS [Campylobacterota bacterium]
MSSILWIELVVGIIVSFTLLGIFVWGAKQGQFDDGKKMMDGLLFDSTEDLQDAIIKDEKVKKIKKDKENRDKNNS